MARRASDVSVLEADRGLARLVPPELAGAVPQLGQQRAIEIRPGRWLPPEDPEPGFGLLVLEGVLVRRVAVRGAAGAEILAAGDVLRPWDEAAEEGSIAHAVTWRALAPTRLAVLDRRFALFAARVPALGEELLARCTRRASSQALTAAVSHLTGIDDRLTMVLWHLADRWGRVGPSGVRIPLRLTHDLLAALIGARRPSVTTALRRLEDEGAVRRQPDGALLLVGEPPAADGGEAGLRVAA